MPDTTVRADPVRFRVAWSRDGFDGVTAFANMREAFERSLVAHALGLRECSYTFAGQRGRMRIVGPVLAERIARPFAHLRTRNQAAAAVNLQIDLWDESETGVPRPVDSLTERDETLRAGKDDEYGLVMGSPDDRYVGCRRPQMITWYDRATKHLVGWVANAGQLLLYERGKPLFFPLVLWHLDADVPVVHAALVSRDGQGVLLGGRGGTGKTTTALACLDGCYDCVGDDYIGLQAREDGSIVGHGLYDSTWLNAGDVTRFPRVVPHVVSREILGETKVLVPLSQIYSGQLFPTAPIRAIALPRVVNGRHSRTRPASKGEALLALSPSSVLQLPISSLRIMSRLVQLVQRVPCYWLELGTDLRAVPHLIEEILAEVGPK